jgi:putative hemolysin
VQQDASGHTDVQRIYQVLAAAAAIHCRWRRHFYLHQLSAAALYRDSQPIALIACKQCQSAQHGNKCHMHAMSCWHTVTIAWAGHEHSTLNINIQQQTLVQQQQQRILQQQHAPQLQHD